MPKLVKGSASQESVAERDLLKLSYNWELIHDTSVPVLFREEKKYIPVRVVEILLLSRYPTQLPDELQKCWRCQSYYMTEDEVSLLNHINKASCKPYGKVSFTTNDIVIDLSEFRPLYELVVDTVLSNRAKELGHTTGGWLQIDNAVCPYVYRNDVRYVPGEVIQYCSEINLTNLTQHEVTNSEIDILNDLCQTAVRDFTFMHPTTKLISMVDLILQQYPVVFELPTDDPIGSALPLDAEISPDGLRRLRSEAATKFNVYLNKKYLLNTICIADSSPTDSETGVDLEAELDLPTVLDSLSEQPTVDHSTEFLPDLPKYTEKHKNPDLPEVRDSEFLPSEHSEIDSDSAWSGGSDVEGERKKKRNKSDKDRQAEKSKKRKAKDSNSNNSQYEIERQRQRLRPVAPKPSQSVCEIITFNRTLATTAPRKDNRKPESLLRSPQQMQLSHSKANVPWPSYLIMENTQYLNEILMPSATNQLDLSVLRYRYHPPLFDSALMKRYGITRQLNDVFRHDIIKTDKSLQHVVNALQNNVTVDVGSLQLISRLIKMKNRILDIFKTARQTACKDSVMLTVGSEELKNFKEAIAVLSDASESFSFWNATAHRISVGGATVVNKMIMKTILDRNYALSFHKMPDILHFMVAGILGIRDTFATNNFWFLQEIMSLALVASNTASTNPSVAYGLMRGRIAVYVKTFQHWFNAILGFNGKQFLNNQFSELAAKMYTVVYKEKNVFGPSIRMHYLDSLISKPDKPLPPSSASYHAVNPLQLPTHLPAVPHNSLNPIIRTGAPMVLHQPVQTNPSTTHLPQFLANHPVLNTISNMSDSRPQSRQSGTGSPDSHNSNSSFKVLPSLPKKLPLDNQVSKIPDPASEGQSQTQSPTEKKEIKSEACKAFKFKSKKIPSCKKGDEVWFLMEDVVLSLFPEYSLQKVLGAIAEVTPDLASRAPADVILSFKDYNDMTPEEKFESEMAVTTESLTQYYEQIVKVLKATEVKSSEKSMGLAAGSVTQQNEGHAEITKSQVSRSELSKSEVSKSEVSKSEISQSEIRKPEVSKSEVSESKISESNVDKPESMEVDNTDHSEVIAKSDVNDSAGKVEEAGKKEWKTYGRAEKSKADNNI